MDIVFTAYSPRDPSRWIVLADILIYFSSQTLGTRYTPRNQLQGLGMQLSGVGIDLPQ